MIDVLVKIRDHIMHAVKGQHKSVRPRTARQIVLACPVHQRVIAAATDQ